MIQFTVVHKVDTARHVSDFICVLPGSLFSQNVRKRVLQGNWLLGQLRSTTEKAGVQVKDLLTALIVFDDLDSLLVLRILCAGSRK